MPELSPVLDGRSAGRCVAANEAEYLALRIDHPRALLIVEVDVPTRRGQRSAQPRGESVWISGAAERDQRPHIGLPFCGLCDL
jgi:hypothetical protein